MNRLLISLSISSVLLLPATNALADVHSATPQSIQPNRVYYNTGTTIEDGASGTKTRFNSFVQMRSEFTNFDSDSGKNDTSGTSITLLRLSVAGDIPQSKFNYKVEGDLVGKKESTGLRSQELKDAFLEWAPETYAKFKLGQFKVPLSRQYTSSDIRLQFAERSVANDTFNLSRQFGGGTTLQLADPELTLGLGIFNGLSDGEAGNNRVGRDTGHTGAAALRWTPLGTLDPTAEGDVDYTSEAALSFGTSLAYSRGSNDRGTAEADTSDTRGTVDVTFKYQGISIHGEGYAMEFDSQKELDSRNPKGYYLQGGFFLLPRKLEVVGRISAVDCDAGLYSGPCKGLSDVRETTAGLSYYFLKHSLKAQFNIIFQDQENLAGEMLHNQRAVLQISAYL